MQNLRAEIQLVPDDPAGVYDPGGAVIGPDGSTYAYLYARALTDLYLANRETAFGSYRLLASSADIS